MEPTIEIGADPMDFRLARRLDESSRPQAHGSRHAAEPDSAARLAAIALLALASISFAAPTIMGLGLVVAPGLVTWLLPVFHNVEEGPWAFLQEHWTAIPALAGGAFVAYRGSRRTATLLALALMLFVVVCGSLALQLQPSEAALRALASEVPGDLIDNTDALLQVWAQIDKTRAIAIPFLTALAGAAAVAGRGR